LQTTTTSSEKAFPRFFSRVQTFGFVAKLSIVKKPSRKLGN